MAEIVLRFWGRDAEQAVRDHGLETTPEGDHVHAMWFDTDKAVAAVQATLHDYAGLVTAVERGPWVHHLTVAHVTLRVPDGREFHLRMPYGYGYPPEAVQYHWRDGNYACDDNRSLFIQQQCDPDFPEHDCGHTIALVDLRIERVLPQ